MTRYGPQTGLTPELVARRLGFEHSLFAGDWQQEGSHLVTPPLVLEPLRRTDAVIVTANRAARALLTLGQTLVAGRAGVSHAQKWCHPARRGQAMTFTQEPNTSEGTALSAAATRGAGIRVLTYEARARQRSQHS